MSSIDYKDWLLAQLKDLDFAAGYLSESVEEGEAAFLVAVRDVVEAQGGMSRLSKKTSLNREGLYDMFSESGNPRFSSLSTVIDSLGLQISIRRKDETKAA